MRSRDGRGAGSDTRPMVYPTKSEANVTGCDQSPYAEMYAAAPS